MAVSNVKSINHPFQCQSIDTNWWLFKSGNTYTSHALKEHLFAIVKNVCVVFSQSNINFFKTYMWGILFSFTPLLNHFNRSRLYLITLVFKSPRPFNIQSSDIHVSLILGT